MPKHLSLETQFMLEQTVQSLRVVTSPRRIDEVVRAHTKTGQDNMMSCRPDGEEIDSHCRDIRLNGSQEGMKIDLMYGGIVDVAATGRSVSLLFVQDVMLRAGLNSGVLETLDSVVGGFSSEVWVTSSHFPLTTCNGTDMRVAVS